MVMALIVIDLFLAISTLVLIERLQRVRRQLAKTQIIRDPLGRRIQERV
jgi:HAMP domain-containing protein